MKKVIEKFRAYMDRSMEQRWSLELSRMSRSSSKGAPVFFDYPRKDTVVATHYGRFYRRKVTWRLDPETRQIVSMTSIAI